MPAISVIIPVYRVEKYLPACLDSLLCQTFEDFEAICVNDGSPDNCGEILEKYARKDKRFKIVTQANQGVAAARNTGLNLAQGEYISFIDSDDEIAPQFLEKLYQALVQTPKAQFSWCDIQKGLSPAEWTEDQNPAVEYHALLSRLLCRQKPKLMGIWNKLYKKDLLKGLSFDSRLNIGEDLLFLFQLLARSDTAIYVPQAMYFYRCRPDSAMNKPLTEKRMNDELLGTRLIFETLQHEKMDALVSQMFRRFIAKQFFYSVTRTPYTQENDDAKLWLKKYLPALQALKDEKIFCPSDLSFKNRLKCFWYLSIYQKLLNCFFR